MIAANKCRNRLCRVMENITDFDFITPDARLLRREIRQWYYGGRSEEEADKLLERFRGMFSGNMILDAAGGLLWTIAEQSPVEMDGAQSAALAKIPRGKIVGRTIRAYETTAAGTQAQFQRWQTEAEKRIQEALNETGRLLESERRWYISNRMSLPSALAALAGMAALAWGSLFLFSVIRTLPEARSFYETVSRLPSSWHYGQGITRACLGVFVLDLLLLVLLLPRMAVTLCAGLFWIFYQRGRFRLRSRRLARFRRVMEREGLGGYRERLRAAARLLSEQPPDAPWRQDPSRALLGRAGPGKVFRRFSLRPVSPGWIPREFFKTVENRHVKSRLRLLIFSAALVLLRDFLLQTGPVMAFLHGLL